MTRLHIIFLFLSSLVLACGGGESSPDANQGPDAAPGADADLPDGGTPGPLREHAGGIPSTIDLISGNAYIAIGPRLTIWDVSTPTAPVLLGQTEPLPGNIDAIAVANGRAYVSQHVNTDGQIHVYDVSDPAAPVAGTSFRTVEQGMWTNPSGLAVYGDVLLVADREQGVFQFDLTDPDAPAPLGIVDGVFGSALRVVGDRLYVVNQGFIGTSVTALALADLSYLGDTPMGDANGFGFTTSGLAVGAGIGVQVIDVADFSATSEVFRYDDLFTRALAVNDQNAFVPADDGLHVLALDALPITRIGPLDLPTADANAAAVAGDQLVVIGNTGQLLTADVSSPASAARQALVDISLCTDCISAAVDGDRLFIADFSGGLRTGTLRDLGMRGRAPLPAEGRVGFEDVVVAGNVAYVADWSFGLRIFDVSDPAAPTVLAAMPTAGYPSSVALNGEFLYLGESTNGGMLRVIDVSDPTQPAQLGAITTSKARAVRARGNLAFVADESLDAAGGLRIFDTTNPAAIALVGYYDGCANALDVALTGDLAILACGGDGFHILDIADPAVPTFLSSWPAPDPGAAWSVAADGDRAYLGHDFGMTVVDLADPEAPVMVTEKTTVFTVRRLTVPASGHVVATAGIGGIYQWELP